MPTPPHDDSPPTLWAWLSPIFSFLFWLSVAFCAIVLAALMLPELWRV